MGRVIETNCDFGSLRMRSTRAGTHAIEVLDGALVGLGLAWFACYIAVTSVTKNRWGARFTAMIFFTIILLVLYFGWSLIGPWLGME